MSEYISVQDAVEHLTKVFYALYGAFYPRVVIDEVVKKALSEVPTVKIVRCRDCRYGEERWGRYRCSKMDEDWDIAFPADHFCSYGERKEEDE